MKFLFSTVAACALAPFAFVQQADALPLIDYVKVGVSQTSADVGPIEFEPDGFGYGVAAGMQAGPFRLEFGYDRLEADAVNLIEGGADYYSASLNLDIPLATHLNLFGGGGVGYVDGEATVPVIGEVGSVHDSDWHLQAGLNYDFGPASLEFSYRRIMDLEADVVAFSVMFPT